VYTPILPGYIKAWILALEYALLISHGLFKDFNAGVDPQALRRMQGTDCGISLLIPAATCSMTQ
jgi:hypothetical protein